MNYNNQGELILLATRYEEAQSQVIMHNLNTGVESVLISLPYNDDETRFLAYRSFWWQERELVLIPHHGTIEGIDWNTGAKLLEIHTGLNNLSVRKLNPAGTILTSSSYREGTILWNMQSSEQIVPPALTSFTWMDWSPDGKSFRSLSNGILRQWGVAE
jgi:hypothetical protein